MKTHKLIVAIIIGALAYPFAFFFVSLYLARLPSELRILLAAFISFIFGLATWFIKRIMFIILGIIMLIGGTLFWFGSGVQGVYGTDLIIWWSYLIIPALIAIFLFYLAYKSK